MKERHLLGFSLSFCVKDICMGKVDIKEVLFIHSACRPYEAYYAKKRELQAKFNIEF